MAERSSPSLQRNTSCPTGTLVKEEALPRLANVLYDISDSWDVFTKKLGVPAEKVSEIRAANAQTGPNWLSTCLKQALEWWVNNHDNPTYEVVIETTATMNRALAQRVKEFMAEEQDEGSTKTLESTASAKATSLSTDHNSDAEAADVPNDTSGMPLQTEPHSWKKRKKKDYTEEAPPTEEVEPEDSTDSADEEFHDAQPDLRGTLVKEEALPRLANVLCDISDSWDVFTKKLGVPAEKVSEIRAANAQTGPNWLSTCLKQALEWWLNNHDNPTYEVVIETTATMNRALAQRVKEFMAEEQDEGSTKTLESTASAKATSLSTDHNSDAEAADVPNDTSGMPLQTEPHSWKKRKKKDYTEEAPPTAEVEPEDSTDSADEEFHDAQPDLPAADVPNDTSGMPLQKEPHSWKKRKKEVHAEDAPPTEEVEPEGSTDSADEEFHDAQPDLPAMNREGDPAIPCLGRPFQLGMLYNCHNDQLIPDITLWNQRKLQEALSSKPQETSGFEIIAENSIEMKAFKLGVDVNLKLSFLGGLVKVSGAAEYLDDQISSKNQARVSLKYQSTSRFDQLTMEQLGNLDYPNIVEEQTATHVVTGIVYGADAVFVFDREVSHDESLRKVHGFMQVMIESVPKIGVSGDGNVSVKESDKKEVEKFRCTFHGDLRLPENPSTFEGAVKIYRELPKLLGQKDVPKKVWLYPLSKLNSKAAIIIRKISSGLVSQTQRVMEDVHEFEMECSDLMKSEVYNSFTDIREQLSSFKDNITEYRVEFAGNLATMVPQIRGGGKEEAELAHIFKAKDTSPFSHRHLLSWITGKKREEKMLESYLKTMQGIHFAFSRGDMDSIVYDLENEYVISFTFKIAGRHDPYLDEMFAYLHTRQTSQKSMTSTPWYANCELVSDMRLQVKKFASFALANKKNQGTKFVVSSSESEEYSKGAIIELYESGMPEVFEPPGQPGKPSASNMTHESIQLQWSAPPYGAQHILSYTVFCREPSQPPDKWYVAKTSCAKNYINVSGLDAQKVYCFKVNAQCKAGVSVDSEISDPIMTTPSPANRITQQIKSKSRCIKAGPLSVYELPVQYTMKDTKRSVAKCFIDNGWKVVTTASKEKVLMVVGATGAGKSTLINGMVNYILGVKWKGDFRFKLIAEEGSGSQAHSQTKWITAYTLHQHKDLPLPYTLTIIDTPGFGDTKGTGRDKEITSQIKEFFSIKPPHGIDHLDGIGFVTPSSNPRLTPTQRYIFDSILRIFGKDVVNNIFLMVTFADSDEPPVLSAIKDAKIPYSEFYKFNNSALFKRSTGQKFDELFWEMGLGSFEAFFTSFQRTQSISLSLTRDVLSEREHLQAVLDGLQSQIKQGLSELQRLHHKEEQLKRHEDDIANFKNFTYTTMAYDRRKVSISGYFVTNCNKCTYTCHDECVYGDNDTKQHCAVMGLNGYCGVCPKRCHWQYHKNNPFKWELVEVPETNTHKAKKRYYDTAVSGKAEVKRVMESVNRELKNQQSKVLEMVKQVQQCLNRLGEIALQPDSITQVEYLELQIESEKQQHEKGWQDRVKYYETLIEESVLLEKIQGDDAIEQIEKSTHTSWTDELRKK